MLNDKILLQPQQQKTNIFVCIDTLTVTVRLAIVGRNVVFGQVFRYFRASAGSFFVRFQKKLKASRKELKAHFAQKTQPIGG